MDMEVTGTKKKLFSCTDSSVVDILKVVNKVEIETGFPCVPTIYRIEGGGWGGGAFSRGALV